MKAVVSRQPCLPAVNGRQITEADLKSPVGTLSIFSGIVYKQLIKISAGFLFFIMQAGGVLAQGDTLKTQAVPPVDMAGTMRSNGKIYVVVAVLVIILAGLFTYLARLDRKITRLEKGKTTDS